MASLRAHLRQAGDHGRLGFHPECPVCRDERLAGALPSDALISRRMQGLAAAGVLAFSTVSPAAVLAAEGDQDQLGTADPAAISEPGADPEAGPGDTDAVPDDADASADDNGADGAGPVEPDPVTDSDPAADAAESGAVPPPPAASSASGTPAPAATPPSGQPAGTPPRGKQLGNGQGAAAPEAAPASGTTAAEAGAAMPGVAPVAATPAAPSTARPGTVEARDGNERAPARKRAVRRVTHKHRPARVVVVRSAPVAPVAPARPTVTTVAYVAQQAPAAAPAPVVVRRAGRPAKPGDRTHVVFAGESLWSVAQDVLGATATVGEVAREVDRLWALNRERIGTGDRDLLMIGTRLVLR